MLNKVLLRKDLRIKRQAITPSLRQKAGLTAATLLQEHTLFQQSTHIAVYLARDDEFETQALVKAIWQAKKNCYLPALVDRTERKLDFALYNKKDALRLNALNILESENTTHISPSQLDLVIMPLVGFDLCGHRLGLGGGYYDKTFFFRLQNPQSPPFLLGLGYENQGVSDCPCDEWDVPLNGVLTEERLIIF